MGLRWSYALVFMVLGTYLAGLALTVDGFGWLLVWPAASFMIVAAAYAGVGPRVFGKRPDGILPTWSILLNLPFLLFAWSVWHLQRLLTREPCCHEIVPGLWIGRRPLSHELPPGIMRIIDLTAEFSECRQVRSGRAYKCLPTLDGCLPPEASLRDLVTRLAAESGAVYVHCAQGHGRSGLVAAAVLLARGLVDNPKQAVAMVRAVRPGVRLGMQQQAILADIARRTATTMAK